jgi:hypothetical protein
MLLSEDALIPERKLTKYLLVPLEQDDKSKFLAQAGYTLDNWQELREDLRTQVLTQLAKYAETTDWGDKYSIRCCLVGRNGVELKIRTIWLVTDRSTVFVTLIPDKGA